MKKMLNILFLITIVLGLSSCDETSSIKPSNSETSASQTEELYFLGKWQCIDTDIINTWFIIKEDYTLLLNDNGDIYNYTYKYFPVDGRTGYMTGTDFAEYANTLDWIYVIEEYTVATIYLIDESTCIWEWNGNQFSCVKIY